MLSLDDAGMAHMLGTSGELSSSFAKHSLMSCDNVLAIERESELPVELQAHRFLRQICMVTSSTVYSAMKHSSTYCPNSLKNAARAG